MVLDTYCGGITPPTQHRIVHELDALLPAVLEGVFKHYQSKAYPAQVVELGMAAEP